MKVLICGGGTGGHINPALAIADKIKKENKDAVIEYVGTKRGLEATLVPKAGLKIHFVEVRGFKRKLTLDNIDAAIKAVTSVIEAKKIIKEFKPDIAIGTGGYVCWPVLKAASKAGVPTLVHESNAFPGVTTRMLAPFVDKVVVGFEESKKYLKCDEKKIVVAGSPVSEKMLCADKAESRKALGFDEDEVIVLSAGGSQGARPLNENVFELIKNYTYPCGIRHIHATGNAGWETQKKAYLDIGFTQLDNDTLSKGKVVVKRYIYNMHQMLSACDIEICRAGAMTLSELAVLGKAAVIVPSPYVPNNHQYKNAKVLADKNAAILIEEKNLTGEILTQQIKELVENSKKRKTIEENVKQFAVTDSLDRIYGEVLKILK